MNKISSFTVNHLELKAGVYLSRVDGDVCTFDVRLTRPNAEAVMSTTECHTIEHLGATFLRNHPAFGEKIVYFGPMGCRTGFYLLVFGKYKSADIIPLVEEMFRWIAGYEGDIPGASPRDCGNWVDLELECARARARDFLARERESIYPE